MLTVWHRNPPLCVRQTDANMIGLPPFVFARAALRRGTVPLYRGGGGFCRQARLEPRDGGRQHCERLGPEGPMRNYRGDGERSNEDLRWEWSSAAAGVMTIRAQRKDQVCPEDSRRKQFFSGKADIERMNAEDDRSSRAPPSYS